MPNENVTTDHTVQTGPGKGVRMSVDHEDYVAVQYEFYIPQAIWNDPDVQLFITRLGKLEAGSTTFAGLIGEWQGEEEVTRIYRKIIRASKLSADNLRHSLRSETGPLMAKLNLSQNPQQCFMFTETVIRANESRNVQII